MSSMTWCNESELLQQPEISSIRPYECDFCSDRLYHYPVLLITEFTIVAVNSVCHYVCHDPWLICRTCEMVIAAAIGTIPLDILRYTFHYPNQYSADYTLIGEAHKKIMTKLYGVEVANTLSYKGGGIT